MDKEFKSFVKLVLSFWLIYVMVAMGAFVGAIYLISKLFT